MMTIPEPPLNPANGDPPRCVPEPPPPVFAEPVELLLPPPPRPPELIPEYSPPAPPPVKFTDANLFLVPISIVRPWLKTSLISSFAKADADHCSCCDECGDCSDCDNYGDCL